MIGRGNSIKISEKKIDRLETTAVEMKADVHSVLGVGNKSNEAENGRQPRNIASIHPIHAGTDVSVKFQELKVTHLLRRTPVHSMNRSSVSFGMSRV